MGTRKGHLGPRQKAIIDAWHSMGRVLPKEIAAAVGCGVATALKWCPYNPDTLPPRPLGRPCGRRNARPKPGSVTERVVSEMEAGLASSVDDLAKRHGVNGQTIESIRRRWCPDWQPTSRRARRLQIPPNLASVRNPRVAEAVAEMRLGVVATYEDLCERHGVTKAALQRARVTYCPEWRPVGSRYRLRDQPAPGSTDAEIVQAMQSGVPSTVEELAERFGVTPLKIYCVRGRWIPSWKPSDMSSKEAENPLPGSVTEKVLREMKEGTVCTAAQLASRHSVNTLRIYFIRGSWCPQWVPVGWATASLAPRTQTDLDPADASDTSQALPVARGSTKKKRLVTIIGQARPKTATSKSSGRKAKSEKIAEAVVASWNAGLVNSAAAAARRHGITSSTAATILHRYTDYDGKARK